LVTAPTQPKATCHPLPLNAMPAARPAWTVLDTAFGNGSDFLARCDAWRADPSRSHMLHYVGLLQLQHQTAWAPELGALLEDAGAGFHRLTFDEGRISLTLCIGPTQAMLTEQRMQADWVALDTQSTAWDIWTLKALARCCKRGAILDIVRGVPPAQEACKEAGFESCQGNDKGVGDAGTHLCFNPPWNILKRGAPLTHDVVGASSCVVIGAGLAGASVAHALAVRGWQLTVLDSHPAPAGGASGLPVGLVVPHVSADDSARSRMSRNGSRLMLQYAAAMLRQGQQWERTGVLERRAEGDLWHKYAGWIQPESLVQAWLAHARIRFVGRARVQTLRRSDGLWTLLDACDNPLAQAHHVVFANAMGCQNLLQSLPPDSALEHDVIHKLALLQALHGTLSSGDAVAAAHTDAPANGNGSYVPEIPTQTGLRWFAGATFETDASRLLDVGGQHLANLERLKALLPDVGVALKPAFNQGSVAAWTGTRCVSHDRMPLVGALESGHQPTLWISAAMGARGLSFSALCAQWLVANMCAEPWPAEASLTHSGNVQRQRRQRL
jgi:tRNA 5-methylaminomethyl-2-thiouridine biosynthesis bifunctional protein